jgi:hypothetical protein
VHWGWTCRSFAVALGVVGLAAALGACGDTEDDVGTAAPQDWQVQALGPPPPDSAPVVLRHDGRTTVASTNQQGDRIVGWTVGGDDSDLGDATFTGGPVSAYATAGAVGDDELLLLGTTWEPGEVVAWTSPDGATWEAVEDLTGFDGPAEVSAVVRTPDGYVAVGWLRIGDGALGGWRATSWRSSDGRAWDQVPLASDGSTTSAVDLAVVDGDLVALANSDRAPLVWRSEDGGATWQRHDVLVDGAPARASLTALEVEGGVLVAAATEETDRGSAALVARSTDGGRTWSEVVLPAETALDVGHLGSVGVDDDGTFWLAGSRSFDPFTDPDRCYADLERCAGPPRPLLLHSADAATWDEVDTGSLVTGEQLDVERIEAPAEGGTAVLAVGEGGLTLLTSADGAAVLPVVAPPEVAEPDGTMPPLAEWEQDLEVGTVYRYPLYTHCGIGQLGVFDDRLWVQVDGPDAHTGAGEEIPEGWPQAGGSIYGYLTLVDEDTIEYSIEVGGEAVATYEPVDAEPDGCA